MQVKFGNCLCCKKPASSIFGSGKKAPQLCADCTTLYMMGVDAKVIAQVNNAIDAAAKK